ncbi:trypsin-like [Spodoptera litura]|uniref:Trypsin-like n=1 Tax=Spodoptera litura TaxID=69820 RepID=A0A9J7ES65_SPOLT|nr:trypsin-like [Spodoptera litura]
MKEEDIEINEIKYNELDEHTLVTDAAIFPYVVAVLKMSRYLSAGALIDENWVLTAADALFLVRESSRMLRVRLGSINYRKGGTVLPIKYVEIHPYFDDSQPIYDLALIRLPEPVRFTPSLRSIRLQKSFKEIDATHFIVTSWPFPMSRHGEMTSDYSDQIKSMELIKQRRILSVTHVHPSDADDCTEELISLGINETETMMCLDTGVMLDPCLRDVGAPVVLNDVLWGIVSSWRPPTCDPDLAGPSFATLVSAPTVDTWIHDTVDGHNWINTSDGE